MLSRGDAILMPTPGSSSLHLWIIVTDPSKDSGAAAIVCITTRRAHSDLTLIVKPSDHPWIKHDSVVMYADSQVIDTIRLEQCMKTKPDDYVLQKECSTPFLNKIKEGLLRSKFTPRKITKYCISSWNSP